MARIASPSTNASFLHRGVSKLVGNVNGLQFDNDDAKASLRARRTALVKKITISLKTYHLAIFLVIKILEQSKHGSVSRHIKTKAEYLNLVARTVEMETSERGVRGNKMVYTDEVNGALENYMLEFTGWERKIDGEEGRCRESPLGVRSG